MVCLCRNGNSPGDSDGTMTLPTKKTALTLMAHPDDAEFLCAGTLIRLAEAGWEVHIATVAPGDCGTMTENRWDISASRTGEAADGRGPDRRRRTTASTSATGSSSTTSRRSARAIDLFRRVAPSLVFTHAAEGLHDGPRAWRRCWPGRPVSSTAAPNVSDVPAAARARACRTCTTAIRWRASTRWASPSSRPRWSTSPAQLEKKTEMLACHASQREWLRAHHGMDEYIDSMKRHAALRGQPGGRGGGRGVRPAPRPRVSRNDDLLAELFGDEAGIVRRLRVAERSSRVNSQSSERIATP